MAVLLARRLALAALWRSLVVPHWLGLAAVSCSRVAVARIARVDPCRCRRLLAALVATVETSPSLRVTRRSALLAASLCLSVRQLWQGLAALCL